MTKQITDYIVEHNGMALVKIQVTDFGARDMALVGGVMKSPLWAMPDTSYLFWPGMCNATCKMLRAFLVYVLLGSVVVVHVALLSVLGLSESDGNMMTRNRNLIGVEGSCRSQI
jgi:hypothetical protein